MVGPEGVQVEVGFTIDPAHQRKGLASDAVSALLTWLFGELGKHRVLASTDPSNSASIALLTNLGFRQEAHHHQSYRFCGAWVDRFFEELVPQASAEQQHLLEVDRSLNGQGLAVAVQRRRRRRARASGS